MEKLEWTGERYVPWADDYAVAYEHLHRYGFAKEFVRGKRVLDLACGEGYGSFILSETADSVTGIDIDDLSVRHASSRYAKDNLSFITGSITKIPIEGESLFDVIVCFEAIEHVKEHDSLMSEVKRLLKKEGAFIVSSPNKYIYSDLPNYKNPFHVKELYLDEFRKLLSDRFKNVYLYGQKVYPGSNIFPLFKISKPSIDFVIEMTNSKEFVFLSEGKKIAKYFIAVASDAGLAKSAITGNSFLVDQSESIIHQKNSRIGNLEGAGRQKDEQLKAKDERIKVLDGDVKQRDEQLKLKDTQLRQKDDQLKQKSEQLVQRDAQIRTFESSLQARDAEISERDELLRQRDEQVRKYEEIIAADRIFKEKCVAMLNEYKETVSAYENVLAERERLDAELTKMDARVQELIDSWSWKLTGPLRAVYGLWLKGKRKPGAGKD
jgi:ubiquinone/menaquinone biosynthesis C-methylase UbiE